MTIALVCVFAFFLVIYATRMAVFSGQVKRPEGYDNHHPRDQQARLEGPPRRANAAQQNGFEAFGPFAASVIIAQGAGASQHVVNGLAIAFVALRAVYVYAYIADKPMLRSGVWTLAFGCVCTLFVLPFFK